MHLALPVMHLVTCCNVFDLASVKRILDLVGCHPCLLLLPHTGVNSEYTVSFQPSLQLFQCDHSHIATQQRQQKGIDANLEIMSAPRRQPKDPPSTTI